MSKTGATFDRPGCWITVLIEGKPMIASVIVFRYPNYEHSAGYSGVDFIKRVVALPGDTISYEKDQEEGC